MKTNTITMQAGPQGAQPVGAGTRLRNAINKMTPGSSRQQDSFDSALSEARDNRSAQGTGERAAQTERPKAAEAARPEAGQDKSKDQPANTESTAKAEQTAKEAGQSSRETAAQSAKDAVQEAAEAVSDEAAGLAKQEGTGKAAESGEAKAVTEAEADVEEPAEQTAAAATTLNGMLMAMAAQAEIAPEMEAAPETAAISEAGLPTENTPQTAAELQPGTPGTPGTPAAEKNFAALDSLLPQDADKAAQAVQNQQLMDMLSGNTNSVNLAVQPKAMPAAEAMNTSLASAAADEAAITSGQLGALADSAAEAPALTEVAAANVNAGPAATTVHLSPSFLMMGPQW